MSAEAMPATRGPAARIIDEWLQARADLAAIERAEHPDLTDHHGRVWVWWKGDLYRHCSMAWTHDMVLDERHGLPRARYDGACEICAPEFVWAWRS